MNKWYRLGEQFKGNEEAVNKYLKKNNLCTTRRANKDFSDKDYKDLCNMVGAIEEVENKDYIRGERKYFFYWGMTK